MFRIAGRAFASLLFCLLASQAWAQSALLTLGGIAGSATATVPLTLSGGANPAALQWTFTYPGSVALVTVTGGPAATAAGKTAMCLPSTGRLTCLLFGLNRNTIGNGVIAYVRVVAGTSMPPNPLAFTGAAAVSLNGSPIMAQTAITPLTSVGVASVSCTPTVLTGAVTAACAVALSTKTAGAMAVSLASDNANVKVPASVSVPAGAANASFTATAYAITGADQQATVSATAGASTAAAVLSLSGPAASLAGLVCSPSNILPGGNSTCIVSLTKNAPTAGFTAALASGSDSVAVPASVTVPAGSLSAQFTATASGSAAAGIVAVTARVNASNQTASTSLTISAATQIASFTCTPASIIPGGAAQCVVNLSAAAPAGGWVATLLSSSSNLSVPSTVNIPAAASLFQFSANASALATDAETATLTITVQPATATAKIDIDPNPAFYLHGNKAEIISLVNGATVQPTAGPANWTGKFAVKGSGYMAFDDLGGGDGVAFHNGGGQNTDTAFIHFSGQQVGQVFKSQGEVKFLLKSSYSFAQRQTLPPANVRYVFDVYDDTQPQFAFYTYTSGGRLMFAYTTGGLTSFYTLPAGQEDRVFGAGVVAEIRITWTGSSNALYLNGQQIKTMTFSALPANWSDQSDLTIGSHNARILGGGYYSCDDAIADFQIR